MIPCINPGAAYQAAKSEIDSAIERVLESGWYILGPEVEAFERELAQYLGVDHAVSVANGTEALHLALLAAGVGPGDEVITVSHTAVGTVAAIDLTGATPVLVDIGPDGYTIDPAAVAEAVTGRTRAVIAVHLYGQPADLGPLLSLTDEKGLVLIEDCAQAAGADWEGRKVGSIGRMGAFSFYPTKNLAALGDGGAVVTDDPDLADRLKSLRQYGWDGSRSSQIQGLNSRLDEVQAAVLRLRLERLDEDNDARRRLAKRYLSGLADLGLDLPEERIWTGHVYHLFVIGLGNGTDGEQTRDRLQAALKTEGIQTLVHYPLPVHLQPAYVGRVADSLPRTESAAARILSLPLYPQLDETQADRVIAAVKAALEGLQA